MEYKTVSEYHRKQTFNRCFRCKESISGSNGCCIFNIIKPDDVPCNGYDERVEKCSAENNEQTSFI